MRQRTLSLLLIPFTVLLLACSDDSPEASTGGGTIAGTISIDFTGSPDEREAVNESFEVDSGAMAWDAIVEALGEDNLTFEDFGGDLGIFISGFYGVEAEGSSFWEFQVNGEGSDIGVSGYEVEDGDELAFVYSSS